MVIVGMQQRELLLTARCCARTVATVLVGNYSDEFGE